MAGLLFLNKKCDSYEKFIAMLHSNAIGDSDDILVLLKFDEIVKTILELESRISVLERKSVLPLSKKSFAYDVFISYSHKDGYWVKSWLLPKLEDEGIKVCIDYRDFVPGAPIINEIQKAATQSRKTLLVITPDYIESEWTEFENILVQSLDPAARKRRLIPILRESCELPIRIGGLIYVDLSRPEILEYQFNRLINSINE